jgi:hypothetical protein
MIDILASETNKLKQKETSDKDACRYCEARGNFVKCILVPCSIHDSWIVDQLVQVAKLWQEAANDFANQLNEREGH